MIFRVTTKTQITRTSMAFVEAPTQEAAFKWAIEAPGWLFSPVDDQHMSTSLSKVEPVAEALAGFSLSIAD
jgi:hypothetical protein